MVFMGEVINKPTTNGKRIEEREVSDIVYVGYQKEVFKNNSDFYNDNYIYIYF